MIEPRPTKGRGGMGGYGGKRSRKPLKAQSPKARVRSRELKDRLEEVLGVQESVFGERFCLTRLGHPNWKHKCPSLENRVYPLVLDHVNTRNQKDADRYENLQALCSWCNWIKGSVRGLDFRPKKMVERLRALDVKDAELKAELGDDL